MSTAARRESIPLTEDDLAVLERLLQSSSLERRALEQLSDEVGDSKAALLHALLAVGIDAVRERAREDGYRELLVSRDADDEAEIRTARRRQIANWGDE
ncbi:hypothetical protein [Kutzneria chonburiensis]|uniref:Uncharacterized protein n=1 Tax=Kutzneria chonburiensis TaxID=1483604 RepID=A0ABV6N4X3_9PSEU|nr:hypothetical protein [Kutzneria chonburiensis]